LGFFKPLEVHTSTHIKQPDHCCGYEPKTPSLEELHLSPNILTCIIYFAKTSFCCNNSGHHTIQHLFFDCLYAKFLRRAVHFVLGLTSQKMPMIIFYMCYKQGGVSNKSLLLIGCTTFCWTIWLTSNEVAFNICPPKTFLQVIFRETVTPQAPQKA